MAKHTNRPITCFYCKYEIINKKCIKHIKFKGRKRLVCQHCTKFKHKPLQKKYLECDVQCKSCNKPVMYNKCIACSICDHFYHGKCLDLNKNDINKIDSVCDFFICRQCSNDIFPNIDNIKYNKSSGKEKVNIKKTCLTCSNPITKQHYPNKNVIYDGKEVCLCNACSALGINIPIRDTSLLEFLNCPICTKTVKYESLYCNLCQHWTHPYCNGINRQKLEELGNLTYDWYCLNCSLNIFPNHLINDKIETKQKHKLKKNITDEFITHKDCSVCTKKVTGQETLSCSNCHHWTHKKCIGHFVNRSEFHDFLQYYSNKPWECPSCLSGMLPFIYLDNNEFLMLLLEQNTKPTYINRNEFQHIYTSLNYSDFFNVLNYEESDNKYHKDIDPNNYIKHDDTCTYIIDTNEIKIKSTKELVMMTFNIRSIRKNLPNTTNNLLYCH